MKSYLKAPFFFFAFITIANAGESFIPLKKDIRLASDDLIYGTRVLTSREAQDLSRLKNIDLSILNPKSNDIWSLNTSVLDDQNAIALSEGGMLNFEGALTSNTGLYRFNAISENDSKIYTIHLDKTLHSLLLRKNILRKLGYQIPAIKYLKKIQVSFNSIEERDQFIKKDIPENTLGSASRWVKYKKSNDLIVELYDVGVTEPSENDFYNVAMGVPTQVINSRTLRSLIIPYSILDLYESINQWSWVDGKIDNGAVVLPHFTGNDFSTTLEDAQWMLRRFDKLTRADIKTAVLEAYFPRELQSIIVEKIISRRNSLNRLFKESAPEISFNKKISEGNFVKEGKVLVKDYEGYASRFAFGDAESPFEQSAFYIFSKIQSTVIDNMVAKFNDYLQAYDLGLTRSKFFQKQFEDGLNHFIQTGELKPIGIKTWTSPMINGQLIFSRDIILGNYLGTDNLVQLADTFGASVDMGVYLGIEGLGNNLAGSAHLSTSIVRTFSHIKPVKNIKTSLKEPYRNMFVNLLKNSLKERYLSLSELQHSTESNDEKAKKAQNILKEMNRYLDTGESLIITDRLMPTAGLNLNFNTGLIGAGVGVDVGVTTIKRIHIYKKSPSILQIYDDYGFNTSIDLHFQVSEYISMLQVSGRHDKGHYNLKSYMVNLSTDKEENPDLGTNALGIYNVLKNRNFEILDSVIKPVKMRANFSDRSIQLSLFFLQARSLKGKTYFDISAKDGVTGNYFSYNKGYMRGVNVEAFSKNIANYYLSQQTNGNVELPVLEDAAPSDSFFGRSYTKSARFEASISSDKKFERKFITLSDTREGWSISPQKLVTMMNKVNDKFQTILFDPNQIDFENAKLYKVGYHVNLYEKGVEIINKLNISTINLIEKRYRQEKKCIKESASYNTILCGDLSVLRNDIRKCEKSQTEEEKAICQTDLFEDLVTNLNFSDFKNIVGVDNVYIYGTIDGFRQHSEVLNDTIYSNTIGKIGSKDWEGPLSTVRDLLGLSESEFAGGWMREDI